MDFIILFYFFLYIFFLFFFALNVLWLQKQNLWFELLRFDAEGYGTFYVTRWPE